MHQTLIKVKKALNKGRHFRCFLIVVILLLSVDEAHRSNYGFIDGFARNIRQGLPNASFMKDLQERRLILKTGLQYEYLVIILVFMT